MNSDIITTEGVIKIVALSNKKGVTRKEHLQYAEDFSELLKQLPAAYHHPLLYHKALLLQKGENSEYETLLENLLKQNPVLPEVIWLTLQISREGEEARSKRFSYENMLSTTIPVSIWTFLSDSRLEQEEIERRELLTIIGLEHPSIPQLDVNKLSKIARLFNEMNMGDLAINAYREAIYNYSPTDYQSPGKYDTWTSPNTADLWLTLATLEAQAGSTKWALHALCMAAASAPDRLEELQELVPSIYNPPKAEPSHYDKERLLTIARLYKECNLHPRALEVLALTEKALKVKLTEEIKATEMEWVELIRQYADGRESSCYLFGLKVADYLKSPLKIKVPTFKYKR